MSVSPAPAGGAAGPGGTVAPGGVPTAVHREECPLCRAPLRADQDWCLRCGAAARTRLAAPPKWKGLVVGLAVVALLAIAILAVALVKLTG